MRFFIRKNPRNDQQWKLLASDNSLPFVVLPECEMNIHRLEHILALTTAYRAGKMREIMMEHEVVRWIKESNLSIIRFGNTRHRVTYYEAQVNPLASQELLFGLTLTFRERSHASMFKQAWDTGEGGLIRFNHYVNPRTLGNFHPEALAA
jgi:hypothetical protein